MKKGIIIFLTMVVSAFLVTGCGCSKDSSDNNNGGETTKESLEKSLKITNTGLNYDGNVTIITSKIENISSKKVKLSVVMGHVNYIDQNGEEKAYNIEVYFGDEISPGESRSTENFAYFDLSNATSVTYTILDN